MPTVPFEIKPPKTGVFVHISRLQRPFAANIWTKTRNGTRDPPEAGWCIAQGKLTARPSGRRRAWSFCPDNGSSEAFSGQYLDKNSLNRRPTERSARAALWAFALELVSKRRRRATAQRRCARLRHPRRARPAPTVSGAYSPRTSRASSHSSSRASRSSARPLSFLFCSARASKSDSAVLFTIWSCSFFSCCSSLPN